MNRRGDIHVDWVLSMGIFLVAVVLIFIFFIPRESQEVDKSFLLDRLIENFNKNFTWEVKTSPLFVKNCKADVDGGGETVFSSITFNLENMWEIRSVIYNDVESNVDVDVVGASAGINCNKLSEPDDAANNEFFIEANDGAVFSIVYKNDFLNPGRPKLVATCNPALGDDLNCARSLGGAENFVGINEGRLGDFTPQSSEPYFHIDNIKANWKYPDSSDFWIESDSADLNIDYKTGVIYPQSNVVVREIKTFAVDENGNKKAVSIIFRVW